MKRTDILSGDEFKEMLSRAGLSKQEFADYSGLTLHRVRYAAVQDCIARKFIEPLKEFMGEENFFFEIDLIRRRPRRRLNITQMIAEMLLNQELTVKEFLNNLGIETNDNSTENARRD